MFLLAILRSDYGVDAVGVFSLIKAACATVLELAECGMRIGSISADR